MEQKKKPLLGDGAVDLFSGMASGFSVKFVEHPFDTVKVLQQTGGSQYSGAYDCISKTFRAGGIPALYSGLVPPLLGSMMENVTLFVAYGYIKKALGINEEDATLSSAPPLWKYCLSGAGTGCFSACVLTPVELVKCRLQVQGAGGGALAGTVAYAGPIDCVARIVREEGLRGLWRGNASCLAREIPGNFAWFGAYETVLRGIQVSKGYEKKADVPVAYSALAGSFAGVAYWGVPFPADTVKTKQQTDPRFAGRAFADVFRAVLREEGVAGLYKGAGITCGRAAPAHALLFFAFESASRFFKTL